MEKSRIRRASSAPPQTLKELAQRGAKVILLSHFGRPKGRDPMESLKIVAPALAQVTGLKVAFADDCIGPEAGSRRRGAEARSSAAAREHALSRGRGEKRQGLRRKSRQARRALCQRRLLGRASRARLDGRARPCPALGRGARHGGRAFGAHACARNARAAAGRRRGRGQGFHQARALGQSLGQGRCAHHRRRHGQHLSFRARLGRRPLAARVRARRHRARHLGGGEKAQARHHSAARRRGGGRS